MAIAHQPAMTADPVSTRPALPRSPREHTLVARPPRRRTAARLVALLVATVVCVAVVTAIVAGTAFFAILNFAG
jgi:ferric-dicitrate binding protein FerR (iron transport regulator)